MLRSVNPPALFFTVLEAVLRTFNFHQDFRIGLSISTKNSAGILIEIMLNLHINLRRTDTLTALNPLTYKISIY